MAGKKAKKAKAKSKKTLGAKGPTAKDKEQIAAFGKEVAELAVAHGLAAATAGVNCHWVKRIRDGKTVYVWVCD